MPRAILLSVLFSPENKMANLLILPLLLPLLLTSLEAYRLPTTVTPYHYEVHVTVPISALSPTSNAFQGTAVIYFNVTQQTSQISFHASTTFISISTIELNNVIVPPTIYSRNPTTDILTINSYTTLEVGIIYALRITYVSQLSVTDMYGFYKSSYVNENGDTSYLATTQFQPIYARRVFPCWDEPAFKATFSILVTYPFGLNVLGNTPGTIRTTDNVNNQTTIQFDTTPVMSTYLVAFIVSDFTCTTGESIGTTPYRVCSRSASESIRTWAVDIGPPILSSFNEYTDYNYSLAIAKMDQVAIPDFAAGAMENWGLVTYRETNLLWDPLESSNSYQQSIAAVIAHEFAHMWFGNLVTCNWWSETFLNEGFASLYQYYTVDEVLPSWEMKKQFVVAAMHPVLDTDSYLTAQALQSAASSPAQINNKFGSITYSKGASIFRMVEYVMGATNFRDGLRSYLRQYEYSTTVPEDLWASLSPYVTESSILPSNLNNIMMNWVRNSGYPLLTVTRGANNTVVVTQERFLLAGSDTTSRWFVPVTFTTSADTSKFETTSPDGWLTPSADLTFTLPEGATWIILNNQQAGYFRVHYDSSFLTSISTALSTNNFSNIPDINRAQIVDDVFNLAKVNKLSYTRVFEILEFLQNDISYFPWHRAFNGFNFLLGRLGEESVVGQNLAGHLSRLMVNLYNSVPLTNLNESNQIYTLTQVSAVNWACRLGLDDCVSSVQEMFNAFRVNGTSPNRNLKSIVYCNGLRYSEDHSNWEFLWQQYLTTELATERAVLITALGCTRNETTLNDYLTKSIDSTSGIRSQDANSVFAAVYGGNPGGVDVAFDFLMQYHEAIDNYYQSMNALANLMSGIASRFTDQNQVNRLQNFIATGNLSESFLTAATQALATAQANIAWIEEYRDDLHDFYNIDDLPEVDENESTVPEFRLPSIFQPIHYQVHLTVLEDAFTATGNEFEGTVVILFTTSSNVGRIWLHSSSQNIVVESVALNNENISSVDYSVNSTTDILTIEVPSRLTAGTLYGLRIQFTGTFGSNMNGFYKSSYVNPENETRYLLTTQFQAVNARRAFPCFDEPAFKATFQILITHPSELRAESNTNGNTVQIDTARNLTTTQFDVTPVMSTYLVAFVVSDFTCTQGEYIDTTPYQVCSRDDQSEYRAWAVEIGPKILASLNEYTGYNYSSTISKMDQFAIPDFAAGAMENWGLVTYREMYLLWDPLESTNILRQFIATIIAHEFAHMWFGNLVTCSWWSETFLNEGYATYFEFFTVHDVLPEWELDKQFVVNVHQPMLTTDSYLTSQPLQSPASTPAEVSGKFAQVSYYKGGSIFRMVEHFMGSQNFKAGLQSYLRAHEFDTTKPEDLWTSLAAHVDPDLSLLPADLGTVMENWVRKPGYPVLSVSVVGNNVFVHQERFLLSGQDTSSTWYVPISYTTSVDENKFASTAPSGWLTPTAGLTLTYPAGAQWVVLNNHETAFYRVHYSNELWDALAVALSSANFSDIPELNRAQIADDIFEFTKVGRISFTRAFRVLEFLEQDVSYSSWNTVLTEFNDLFVRVGLTSHIGRAMHAHVRQLVYNFYETVPVTIIDEENHLYTLKQLVGVNLACRLGQENCVAGVRQIFDNFKTQGILPPKNLRTIVYCNGVRHSDAQEDWEFLWEAYRTTNVDAQRTSFLQSLGCTTDENLLQQYLERSINLESGIRPADTTAAFSAVYTNPVGVDVALRFLIENHGAIYEHYQNLNSLGSLITGIAGRFTTEEQLIQLQLFLASGELDPQLDAAGAQAVATAQQNLNWIETYRADFHDYYDLDADATTPTTTEPTTTPVEITTPSGVASSSSSVALVVLLLIVKYFN